MVKYFLSETIIRNIRKNRREQEKGEREKEGKKKTYGRSEKTSATKKEENIMKLGLNKIGQNGGMDWGFPLPFSMLLILLHSILNISYY